MSTDGRPPEATLLRRARKSKVPPVSIRQAAVESGISYGRWAQIESGHESRGGVSVPVVAPADTLARMARAVGVTDDQLTGADREDAAEELAAMLAENATDTVPRTDSIQTREQRRRALVREANPELDESEIDVLLSVAERFRVKYEERHGRERDRA